MACFYGTTPFICFTHIKALFYYISNTKNIFFKQTLRGAFTHEWSYVIKPSNRVAIYQYIPWQERQSIPASPNSAMFDKGWRKKWLGEGGKDQQRQHLTVRISIHSPLSLYLPLTWIKTKTARQTADWCPRGYVLYRVEVGGEGKRGHKRGFSIPCGYGLPL